MRFLRYLDNWLVVAESREFLLQLCDDLRIVINWETLDLQPSTLLQYLGMTIGTSLEWVFPSQVCLVRFREVLLSFLFLPSPLAHMWQQLLGHMASLEQFLPRGRTHMQLLQWHLKDSWSPVTDGPATAVPQSQTCVEAVRWWPQEERWTSGVPLQVPPSSLSLHTDAPLVGWGAHLLYLTASGAWLEEESQEHISVLHMRVVELALAVFLPQLPDQCVVLMNDNASVVAYLRHQGGTVSRRLCMMASTITQWTERLSVLLEARYIPGKKNFLASQLS